jgi:hypothetical protein
MHVSSYFRKRFAIPNEHGSWALFLSPLLIGFVAGRGWNVACLYLIVAATAGFLIRQPIVAWTKVRSGRRPASDLPAIRFWFLLYAAIAGLHVGGLVLRGFGYLLWLAVPAVPVVVWHLWLIANRAERRQRLVEVVGTGVLSLSAIAAMWVGVGHYAHEGWLLWLLMWMAGAQSILYTYVRLDQRTAGPLPTRSARVGLARPALISSALNLLVVAGFAALAQVPWALLLPFAIQGAECLWGTAHPATGERPKRIGIRQLVVTVLFTAAFAWTW